MRDREVRNRRQGFVPHSWYLRTAARFRNAPQRNRRADGTTSRSQEQYEIYLIRSGLPYNGLLGLGAFPAPLRLAICTLQAWGARSGGRTCRKDRRSRGTSRSGLCALGRAMFRSRSTVFQLIAHASNAQLVLDTLEPRPSANEIVQRQRWTIASWAGRFPSGMSWRKIPAQCLRCCC